MKTKKAFIFLPWVVGFAVVSVGALTVNYVKVLNQSKQIASVSVPTVTAPVSNLPDEASVYLEADSQEFQINKRQMVKLIVDTTKSNRKVDFLEAKVCWDKNNLKLVNETKDIVLGKDDSFSGIVMAKVVDEGNNTCARVYVKSERTSSALKAGKLEAVDIYLTGKVKGQGLLIVDKKETKLSGPPVEEKRYKIEIGEVGELSYSIIP